MLDVEGFILVGGASSRMGRDKSHLTLDGQTIVERVAAALKAVTSRISVVGSQRTEGASLPAIPDLRESWGPLGGIEAALRASAAEWCVIVACDLPFVTGDLFNRLVSFIDTVDAVVPIQNDRRPQPLCALYRRHECLTATEIAIDRGEHVPRAILEGVRTRYVDFAQLSDLDGSEYFFFNVNRPENYERAKVLARQSDTRSR